MTGPLPPAATGDTSTEHQGSVVWWPRSRSIRIGSGSELIRIFLKALMIKIVNKSYDLFQKYKRNISQSFIIFLFCKTPFFFFTSSAENLFLTLGTRRLLIKSWILEKFLNEICTVSLVVKFYQCLILERFFLDLVVFILIFKFLLKRIIWELTL